MVLGIVQARMGSSRLPGKSLRPLRGRAMVHHVLVRAAAIPCVDWTILATSDNPVDDELASHVKRLGFQVFRGPEQDVLARFAQAARLKRADAVVRVTGDCPLLCPSVSGRVVSAFLAGGCDYASNTLDRTYPKGLDTEVFAAEALFRADREATDPHDREHVTPYLYRNPAYFRLRSVTDSIDRSGLNWSVDTEEDFRRVEHILADLGNRPPVRVGFQMRVYDDLDHRPHAAALHDYDDFLAVRP